MGKCKSMIKRMKLGFEVQMEYDEEENGYQVEYIYDGEWRGAIEDELKPISEKKAIRISEKIIKILQEELNE